MNSYPRWLAALTFIGMVPGASSRASPPAGPVVFVAQSSPANNRTHVMLFDSDGRFAALYSVMRKGSGAGRLAMERGYWSYCGRWRIVRGDHLVIRDRLEESFSFAAPPHPTAWRERAYAMSGALFGPVRAAIVGPDGTRYSPAVKPPLDPAAARAIRATCDRNRQLA